MAPVWVENNRYYFCGFCHIYYAGRDDSLQVVESPYNYNIPDNVVIDPVLEEENEQG